MTPEPFSLKEGEFERYRAEQLVAQYVIEQLGTTPVSEAGETSVKSILDAIATRESTHLVARSAQAALTDAQIAKSPATLSEVINASDRQVAVGIGSLNDMRGEIEQAVAAATSSTEPFELGVNPSTHGIIKRMLYKRTPIEALEYIRNLFIGIVNRSRHEDSQRNTATHTILKYYNQHSEVPLTFERVVTADAEYQKFRDGDKSLTTRILAKLIPFYLRDTERQLRKNTVFTADEMKKIADTLVAWIPQLSPRDLIGLVKACWFLKSELSLDIENLENSLAAEPA